MSRFDAACEKAERELGHTLEHDPGPRYERKTCTRCGRAVLGDAHASWGSAAEVTCAEAQTQNKPLRDDHDYDPEPIVPDHGYRSGSLGREYYTAKADHDAWEERRRRRESAR